MTDLRIGGTVASDLTSAETIYTVDAETTDSSPDILEWTNPHWSEDYGYYLNIPEYKRAVDTKALWTVGGGYIADEVTTMLLMNIKGNGKDSFNSILKNMIKCKTISMDSFAEIIRDDDGILINLKPLNSGTIKIKQNKKGRIIGYEQTTTKRKFEPDEIFHLSHERMADEIHGTRLIKSLKWLIDARNEALTDWRKVLRRNVKPMRIWYLDTDDTTQIAAFKTKTDAAWGDTENLYVPKGTVETEVASIAPNATLSPIPWISMLTDLFYQSVNVPQIIIGNAKEFTDASGKIVYLSYEQSVKDEQLYIEEQVLGQLNLEINLEFPATLQNELISSREKDPSLQSSQPNDTTAELEGPR